MTKEDYKKRLKACVNELCILCGKYQHEHEGACDGCTWIKNKYDATILQIAKALGVDPLVLYTYDNGVSVKDMDEYYKKSLKACVNELCILCGKYQHEHEGACDGCTWIKDKYDEE